MCFYHYNVILFIKSKLKKSIMLIFDEIDISPIKLKYQVFHSTQLCHKNANVTIETLLPNYLAVHAKAEQKKQVKI